MITVANTYVAVMLGLRGKYDIKKYVELWLTNQTPLDDNAIRAYFPIVESFNGIGVNMDEFTPKFNSGSIRLINDRDTLNFQKRLTDLAGEYAIQGAFAHIYASVKPLTDEQLQDNKNLLWAGKIDNVGYSTSNVQGSQTLTIQVTRPTREYQVSKRITRKYVSGIGSDDIPDRSYGKWLPMVFGRDVQVVPYSSVLDTQPGSLGYNFLYAMCYRSLNTVGRKFLMGGVQKYLTQDLETQEGNKDVKYKEVKSATSYLTPVFDQDSGATGATNSRVNRQKIYPLPYNPGTTNPYIITSGSIKIKRSGAAGASATGTLTVKIHAEQDGFNIPKSPNESLAEAIIDKSAYAAQYTAGTEFVATFAFNRPVPICSTTKAYYISIQGSNEDVTGSTTAIDVVSYIAGVPAGRTSWQTTDDSDRDNQNAWATNDEGNRSPRFKLYAVEFQDFKSGIGIPDEKGLDVCFVRAFWNDFSITRSMPDFNRIDLILELDGLVDSDGVLGLDANTVVTQPNHLINILLHNWTGEQWVAGSYNTSRFSDTHDMYTNTAGLFFREINGRTYGKATNIEVIADIAKNSYSTFTYDGFGADSAYSLLAVGKQQTPVTLLTDDNAIFSQWFVNNQSTVVNTLTMNYARRLDSIHFQAKANQREEAKEFSQSLEFGGLDGDLGETYGLKSYYLYGEQRSPIEEYNYISDEQSARSVAELFLRLHDHPYELVLVDVLWQEFSFLKMYDLVRVQSTELPFILGTASTLSNDINECGLAGNLFLAQDYRAQIIGMNLSLQKNRGLQMQLLLRLCVHENDPINNYAPVELA